MHIRCCVKVSSDKVHHKAMQCNLFVACRNGKMERVCWSGKAVNLGVDDKSFKMEQLDEIMGMSRPGDRLSAWISRNDFTSLG